MKTQAKAVPLTTVVTLRIDKALWSQFKDITPSSITLEKAVIDLISARVKQVVF